MKEELKLLIDEIEDFYTNIRDIRIVPNAGPEEIRGQLQKYDFQDAVPVEAIMGDVTDMMRKWTVQVTHPRYFGLFNPTVHISAVMADALASLYNPNCAVWGHSPAACEIEEHISKFMLAQFGFDTEKGIANFTSGGQEANHSAVLTALTRSFPESGDKGLTELGVMPVFYMSDGSHHSFNKVAHFTGIGRNALRIVDIDEDLKIDMSALEKMVDDDRKAGYHPFMVVGTAGTTGTGVIDPLPELVNFCQKEKLWFHVDAAYGGAAVLSDKLKPCLSGIEKADSITCDAHKWLAVPFGAGMFFCSDKSVVEKTFRIGGTNYMPPAVAGTRDFYNTSMQWTRRFSGIKLFMAMAENGREGYAHNIEKNAELTEYLRSELIEKGWRMVNKTPLPVACFTHPLIENEKISTKDILSRIYSEGETWISDLMIKGKTVLRACVTSFKTEKEDVDFLVETLERIITS
ncbi:pyridoxal phosphate-dependent decarboxylase family protein [candidate division KSB1 bacterium]